MEKSDTEDDNLITTKERRAYKQQALTKLLTKISATDFAAASKASLAVLESRLISIYAEFETLCQEAFALGDKSTSKADEFEERYINALTLLKENLSHSSSHNQSEQKIKLPVIQIPLFNGTMLLSVADFIGVSKASACRTVRDVSNAIAQLYSKYIYMHSDTEQDFYAVSRFPGVLGALDGTHIRIQSPCSQIGEEFRNRKGYFSLNVQAMCNADLLFMNVVARWPGSAHDATIFNNSDLRAQCENGSFGNKWLLGDSAYPLKPYLLTPLINTQTRGQQLYNEAHIRTRNCIERCFGVETKIPCCSLKIAPEPSKSQCSDYSYSCTPQHLSTEEA
uniref:DDE Tnp4 domain-containing protein n=1 Tax=Bombyx mori TaxID=7091 RepID=A0A8R2M9P2_BOMMO|nr:putative nuclease HARBI1 isoform X2 [Bombyx mori]